MKLIRLSLLLIVLVSCNNNKEPMGKVYHNGALRTLMKGDLNTVVQLDSLKGKDNLYALGAASNLKGEIQIFNGSPVNARVENEKIIIDSSFDESASLLVYAQIPVWTEITIPASVKTKVALEEFIQVSAMNKGLDMGRPFPFLVEGEISSLDWHVIDWPEGDTLHTHEKHRNSGLNGTIKEKEVEIIGFFSLHHKTVFTHHSTNIHIHFKTEDRSLAGHVDDLQLGNDTKLKLPKK
ncbi:acetolactate decarboxylase [Robiginitalea myxolifaciens]|uniref:Acetolactate decarboxylase n=1 Tax=Robiginitalea myxolifaciens TaxID=400055 RepID=A0A1I6FVS8_9FLAO|nr:acetolactate decarboxylase [Robiginitalea myxolifaciens]SFR33917.1 acetolactate decarboxylase [Robiginitalea myxolifaciens]